MFEITPSLRWHEIPQIIGLTADKLIRCCVSHPMPPPGYGSSVESLVQYLDTYHYPGIERAVAEKYLEKIRPLLEEGIPWDEINSAVLMDPRGHFATVDKAEARNKTTAHFELQVNKQSPRHVCRAMVAHIEFGLGNYTRSIVDAQYAEGEKEFPDFPEALYGSRSQTLAVTLPAQRTTAELLIPLISLYRRQKASATA